MASITKPKRSRTVPSANGATVETPHSIVWSFAAPKSVRHAQRDEGFAAAWPHFVKHLRQRARLKAQKWTVTLQGVPSGDSLLLLVAAKSHSKDAAGKAALVEATRQWLTEIVQTEFTPAMALETLCIAVALPRLSGPLPQADWLALHHHLWQIAADAQKSSTETDTLVAQLLGVELPLTLAALLPEIVPTEDVLDLARTALLAGLEAVSATGAGLPQTALRQYAAIVESWTRSVRLVDWPSREERRRAQLALKSAVLLGLQMTTASGCIAWDTMDEAPFISAARYAGAAIGCREIPRLVAALRNKKKSVRGKFKTPVAAHLETACLAALRPSWSAREPQISVRYADGITRLEVAANRCSLLTGVWSLDLTYRDEKVKQTSPWTCSFWITDEDVDFLEIQAEFGAGLRVDRQILLTKDGLLLLADCVMAQQEGTIRYESRLPMSAAITPNVDEKMREVELTTTKPVARVLPLALPEWRRAPSVGSLGIEAGSLCFRQEFDGQGLYAPLLFDLNTRRLQAEFTWRQLTVGSRLQIENKDVAAGFRMQAGDKQWLLFRSLAKPAVRSLLGQQLHCEFLLARFLSSGKIKKLIEIE
jgi:hypothetical protein